jgi:hypothetical protein
VRSVPATDNRQLRTRLAIALAAALLLTPASAGGGAAERYPWAKRIAAAERYAEDRAGRISFAVFDEEGRLRGEHVDRVHHSASVVKAMFLVAYLREPDIRDRGLQRSDHRLLGPMIKRSDNRAANVVYGRVGDDALLELARDAGMVRFDPDPTWSRSEITASDQARFFYRLERYVPRRHRRYALRLLKRIVPRQRWGIPPVAPDGWVLHFKGGWSSGVEPGWRVNQAALLREPPRRLALAVLTRYSPGKAYGIETIEGVARRLLRDYERFDRP